MLDSEVGWTRPAEGFRLALELIASQSPKGSPCYCDSKWLLVLGHSLWLSKRGEEGRGTLLSASYSRSWIYDFYISHLAHHIVNDVTASSTAGGGKGRILCLTVFKTDYSPGRDASNHCEFGITGTLEMTLLSTSLPHVSSGPPVTLCLTLLCPSWSMSSEVLYLFRGTASQRSLSPSNSEESPVWKQD